MSDNWISENTYKKHNNIRTKNNTQKLQIPEVLQKVLGK